MRYLIFILCLVVGCKKQNDSPVKSDGFTCESFEITLTKNDYRFLEVRHYNTDNLFQNYTHDYTIFYHYDDPGKVVKVKKDNKNNLILKSIYYLNPSNDNIADYQLDSLFSDTGFYCENARNFNYDTNGYLISDFGGIFNCYSAGWGWVYEIKDGNTIGEKSDLWGSVGFIFNNLDNKVDIVSFDGRYTGKKNRNLIKKVDDTYSHISYEYELYSSGFVKMRTSISPYSSRNNSFHTEFNYIFK